MSVNVRIRNGMAPSAGSGGASEGDIRGTFTDMLSAAGVVNLSGGDLAVAQAASPNMTVVVAAGVGYIPNTAFDATDSDSVRVWDAVVAGTTGSRTLTIGANSSGSTRIDKICLKINTATTPDSTASNIASLIVVAGTPGAGAPATPSYHLLLANVTVANGASSIVTANISDQRVQATINASFFPSTIATTNTAQTFTNKTFTTPVMASFYQDAGLTKLMTTPNTASDTLAALAATQTFTNKRITARVGTTTDSATPTPAGDTNDIYTVTALAQTAAFGAPTGTPTNGQTLVLRVKDNGTARAISFNAIYRFSTDLAAPSTTVLSKTLYLGFMYNSADSKWDCLAILNNF